MLRFSKGLISIILFCTIILLGFINTSNADIEIESLYVYSSLSSNDYFIMMVDVQTSEPYHGIDYYLDDTWIDRAYGDGKRTYDFLWYDESNFGGSLQGTEHTLKLNVMQSVGDDIVVTKTFKVYKPDVNSGYGSDTGVYGETELSRHSYEHPYITFEASVYAQNDTEFEWTSTSRFRHTVTGPNGFTDTKESNPPTQGITANGGTYGPYNESYEESMQIDISGGDLGSYNSDVYIRHYVKGNVGGDFKKDNWDIMTDHDFEWK